MEDNRNKRMADSYKIESAFYINGKEVVFGVDKGAELRYLVGYCSHANPFGIEHFYNCIGTASYAEAMQEFGERIRTEAERSMEASKERGITNTLTYDDCIPKSQYSDYEGQLIVIRADILQRDKQTADYQLCRANGGFGCSAKAAGRSIHATNIYDGRDMRYDRTDVLGIIKPECVPDWAKERIQQMEQKKQRHETER